ncbi:hypothetical protein EDF60_0844 [Leucobacter luti]|uniref:hypothetical protein n=1 Tax=Leucobacter luti TaxID=340320 RepID=UPI001045B3E8|nr:hypothetical protein [Leucobacter luti]MCW2288227.1 hypothetical protein [Leucobacter luti]TCK45614.1 hypothetical protein EDF60_0844 [Leucobacter luti]
MSDVVNPAISETPGSAAEGPEATPTAADVADQDAELSADLEELWQEESPDTARRTETAEEVDGDPDTREADEAV